MRKRVSMRLIVYLIGLVPITVLAAIMLIFTGYKMETSVYSEVEHKLEVSAKALGEYAIENYALKNEFSYHHGYIDSIAETNVDLTLIKDNERFVTTLRNADGSRNEGTLIDNEVYETLLSGGTYYSKDIVINGTDYAVYYEPIKINGEYVGAAFAGQSLESIQNTINSLRLGVCTITVGVYVAFILILFYISYIIARPLKQAASSLGTLADGDLTENINIHTIIVETGSIVEAVNTLQDSLRGIISQVHANTEQLTQENTHFINKFTDISSNIDNINFAVEEIAQGATNQANETTKIAEQISEIGNVIEVTSQEIEILKSSVKDMNMLSQETDDMLNKLVSLNEANSASINTLSEQAQATNSSAEKIQEVINVIQEVTEQTNLLSLNASIEAARAGEMGRGFAVVAGEIRKLADSSSKSAQIIEEIVKELMRNSRDSVEMMRKVLSDTDAEKSALASVKSAYDVLSKEVGAVSDASTDIAAQIDKLSQSRGIVIDSADSLSAISEENAAASQETSASLQEVSSAIVECTEDTKDITQLGNNLQDTVLKFKM